MSFSATFQDSICIEVKKFHLTESTWQIRKHRSPNNSDVKTEFDKWQFAMNRWRDKYQSGYFSAERFLTWLEEHRACIEEWDYEEKLYMMRKNTRSTIVWYSFSDMVYATLFWISLTLFASYNIIKIILIFEASSRSRSTICINPSVSLTAPSF